MKERHFYAEEGLEWYASLTRLFSSTVPASTHTCIATFRATANYTGMYTFEEQQSKCMADNSTTLKWPIFSWKK